MEEFDFLEKFKEAFSVFKSVYDPATLFAAFAAIAVYIVEIILYRQYRKNYKNKKVEKAKALGHTVEAVLVKSWIDRDRPQGWWFHGEYAYTVEGKQYIYRTVSEGSLSKTITLYYIHNPKNAFDDKRKKEFAISLSICILPAMTAAFVWFLVKNIF